jgi:hypothetical protein
MIVSKTRAMGYAIPQRTARTVRIVSRAGVVAMGCAKVQRKVKIVRLTVARRLSVVTALALGMRTNATVQATVVNHHQLKSIIAAMVLIMIAMVMSIVPT